MNETLRSRLPFLLALAVAAVNLLLFLALQVAYGSIGYGLGESAARAFITWLLGTPITFWLVYYWTQGKLRAGLAAMEKREEAEAYDVSSSEK